MTQEEKKFKELISKLTEEERKQVQELIMWLLEREKQKDAGGQ